MSQLKSNCYHVRHLPVTFAVEVVVVVIIGVCVVVVVVVVVFVVVVVGWLVVVGMAPESPPSE